MKFLSFILLTLALLLETTLTTIPLVLISLVCLIVIYRQDILFLFGFVFGLFLDLILFKTVGMSSLFFVIFLFLILLYQRKFEIKTANFVLISSFFGSLLYLLLFSNGNLIIIQAIVSAIIGLLIFKILQRGKIAQ
ncbi:MAG: hypothetical protein AAB702_02455 [Patescibacteria group bacterium]